jgi:hypothetical protein
MQRKTRISPDHMEDQNSMVKTNFKDGVLKGMRKMRDSYPKGFFDFEMGETYGSGGIFETKISIRINPQSLLADTEDIQNLISLGFFEEKASQKIEGKFMLFLKSSRDESDVIAYHPYNDGCLNPTSNDSAQRYLDGRKRLDDIQEEAYNIIRGLLTENSILGENQ